MILAHVEQIVASGGAAGGVVVVGASASREKYGNMIVRRLLENGFKVYPINPKEKQIEGVDAFQSPSDVDENVAMVSFVTPPPVTLHVLQGMDPSRFKVVWFQDGSFDEHVIRFAEGRFETVVRDACVLVALSRLGRASAGN